ncbi:hypothetical protein F5B20DRAFT_585026 [Whalleya microplaca]|nr:hypothetical protein F5B20DRAFT_585026 [Whalleya microplaca]
MPPRGYKYPPGYVKNNVKRGPKPFPGTRRKRFDLRVPPVQPILRPQNSYTKKRKAEVLLWLIHQRFPEARKNDSGRNIAPRRKLGQPRPTPQEEQAKKQRIKGVDAIVCRPPTYHEAEMFWKISASTITKWWGQKERYLSATELENAKLVGGDQTPKSKDKGPNTAAQGATQDLQQVSTTQSQSQPQLNTAQPSVVEISDDSDMESIDSDEDEDWPDPETIMGNAESTEDGQEFQDAEEFQDGEDVDANGVEDTELFNLQTA